MRPFRRRPVQRRNGPSRAPQSQADALAPTGHLDAGGESVNGTAGGPGRTSAFIAKRCIDVAGAAIGLIILSPLFVAVAAAILLADGRPILFRQSRVGLQGRIFPVAKFRTMTRDADAQRADLRQYNEVSGNASFKMTNDPRVTGIGGFLRRSSIDELPQLWNVLRGEMSLVGPRPHPLDDVAGYAAWHRRRLAMNLASPACGRSKVVARPTSTAGSSTTLNTSIAGRSGSTCGS